MNVNATRFAANDAAAVDFFRDHGYVVLRDVLNEAELDRVDLAWDTVVAEGAAASAIDPDTFAQRYPQNRDLWRKNADFRKLLFETRQAEVAQQLLGTSGVRLFHDHAIAKPAHASSTIPWHQDSASWPLDRTGLSIWTATTDVGIDGGCLELLDASHLDGPSTPQDFLAEDPTQGRDDDPRLIAVPVQRGESVLISGLMWHRSRPNVVSGRRLAYLTLWVPATVRFRPEHASWHPTTNHIPVAAGERLDGEWFPLFGRIADADDGEVVAFPAPVQTGGPSMFTASKDIRRHITWLLGYAPDTPAAELSLADASLRVRVADECVQRQYIDPQDHGALLQVLEDLQTNDDVRRRSVARDVYLQVPRRWWSLAGTRIAEDMDCALV